MPGKKNASVSNEPDVEDGKMHMMKCDRTGNVGKPCPVGTQVWLPRKIHKRFQSKPFLFGFCCAVKPMSGPPKSDIFEKNSLKGTFQADATEQYGRRDKVTISEVTEESGVDVCQKVVDVAQETSVSIAKEDITVCHKIRIRKLGSKTIIAMFVTIQMKHQIMAQKKLKINKEKYSLMTTLHRSEVNCYILLEKKQDVANAISVNGKLIV